MKQHGGNKATERREGFVIVPNSYFAKMASAGCNGNEILVTTMLLTYARRTETKRTVKKMSYKLAPGQITCSQSRIGSELHLCRDTVSRCFKSLATKGVLSYMGTPDLTAVQLSARTLEWIGWIDGAGKSDRRLSENQTQAIERTVTEEKAIEEEHEPAPPASLSDSRPEPINSVQETRNESHTEAFTAEIESLSRCYRNTINGQVGTFVDEHKALVKATFYESLRNYLTAGEIEERVIRFIKANYYTASTFDPKFAVSLKRILEGISTEGMAPLEERRKLEREVVSEALRHVWNRSDLSIKTEECLAEYEQFSTMVLETMEKWNTDYDFDGFKMTVKKISRDSKWYANAQIFDFFGWEKVSQFFQERAALS